MALATAVDNVIEGTPVLNATGPVAVEADDDWAEALWKSKAARVKDAGSILTRLFMDFRAMHSTRAALKTSLGMTSGGVKRPAWAPHTPLYSPEQRSLYTRILS